MKSLKGLRKDARQVFSLYTRTKENGVCFTCGVKKDPKEMDCGHFIHRDALDFNEMGNHCQCVHCNHYLHGNLGVYAVLMVKKYGLKRVEELQRLASVPRKFTREELEKILNKYTAKLVKLLKVKNEYSL